LNLPEYLEALDNQSVSRGFLTYETHIKREQNTTSVKFVTPQSEKE